MGNSKNQSKNGKKRLRQHHLMMNKLHQMLRSLGQQQIGNNVIKLDEFQKLRRAFGFSAEAYEKANKQIKNQSDRVIRAQLMFQILQNKKIMQQTLQSMTKLSAKLKQRLQKQQIRIHNDFKTPQKKNKRQFESPDDIIISDTIQKGQISQKTSIQQQLEYKNLTIYTLQRIYFKLLSTERSQVSSTKRQIKSRQFLSLQKLKQNSQGKKLIKKAQQISQQLSQQDQLEQQQILQALRQLDANIQSKMDGILQGINIMNYNALSISQGIDTMHHKILVNLNVINQNQNKLANAQDILNQVTPHAKKPNCICNVVLIVIVALVAYLLVRMFIDDSTSLKTVN